VIYREVLGVALTLINLSLDVVYCSITLSNHNIIRLSLDSFCFEPRIMN
jgi:hypothetical protein